MGTVYGRNFLTCLTVVKKEKKFASADAAAAYLATIVNYERNNDYDICDRPSSA
jgi:hypothetical protein